MCSDRFSFVIEIRACTLLYVSLTVLCTSALSSASLAQSISFYSGGGSKLLTISSAVAGNEPADVIDDLSELSWDATGLGVTGKITVNTSVTGQSFSLFVGLSVTSGSGTEQAERQLTDGMQAADLLRDIPTGDPSGTGTLTYRGNATVSQGNSVDQGSDAHTVTYTILAQ